MTNKKGEFERGANSTNESRSPKLSIQIWNKGSILENKLYWGWNYVKQNFIRFNETKKCNNFTIKLKRGYKY